MKKYLKAKKISLIVVPFVMGVLLASVYLCKVIYDQNRQIEHLVSTSQQLFDQEQYLIANYSQGYDIMANCTLLEPQDCDQKTVSERLESLTNERNQLLNKINNLSWEVDTNIKQNQWGDYATNNN